MSSFFGEHGSYIAPAYAITVVVFVALLVSIRMQYSARKREMAELEKQGVRRRSDAKS